VIHRHTILQTMNQNEEVIALSIQYFEQVMQNSVFTFKNQLIGP